MTPTPSIPTLLRLAHHAVADDIFDLELITMFNTLREKVGLATLLVMIEEASRQAAEPKR
jgi:hypothetical protein